MMQEVKSIELCEGRMHMPFNYNKYRGRIVEKFESQAEFAVAMGWYECSTYLNLNGERGWKQPDVYKTIRMLSLNQNNIPVYFFTLKVQNN